MLYYGAVQNIFDDSITILNFTSYAEGFRRLNLIPPNDLGASSEYDFDVKYMHFILDNDVRFCEFFQIVMWLNEGLDIYIIISEDNWSENLIESLLKLMQQRYGFNGTRVNCFDDVVSSSDIRLDPNYGVLNFDQDLNRYSYIMEATRIKNGGQIGFV